MGPILSPDLSAHLYADERLLHAAVGRECTWLRAFFAWLGLASAVTFVIAATTHRFLFIRVQPKTLRELAFEAMPWHEIEDARVVPHWSGSALKLCAHGGRWKHSIRVTRAGRSATEGIVNVWADEHAKPTTRRRTFVPAFSSRLAS